MATEHDAAVQFLRVAFHPDDWIGVFLKSYVTGRVGQRIVPLSLALGGQLQEWLRRENAADANVYVTVNAVKPHQVSRRRRAIADVRHVFLDADDGVGDVMAVLRMRRDVPSPSYVLTSSLGRAHILWRVQGFTSGAAEALQKMLARQLQNDAAATSSVQLTRLPGFVNHKYSGVQTVTAEYLEPTHIYTAQDFPRPRQHRRNFGAVSLAAGNFATESARRYVAALPVAVAGQHGDLLTFRLCCRLVRGFALTDVQAFSILGEWNARCEPPWSYRELREKLENARRYGREPVGGLLEERP